MNAVEAVDPSSRRGIALLLPDHHQRLESKCQALLASAHENDLRDIVVAWSALELELLEHMAAEEAVILPNYAKHSPDDARRIVDDHARIREIVCGMGVDVELHVIRIPTLQRLVDALDAHAGHEDELMYPWAERHLTDVARRLLTDRIGRWLAG